MAEAALVVASVAAGWHVVRCAGGHLLNNYPFLSSDSFDWTLEGIYLARVLTGAAPERPLPTGRNPVFVVVMTLDALLGQRGLVFAAVSVTAILVAGWLMMAHLGQFRDQTGAALALLAVLYLAPVNSLAVYVLADVLCISLSIGAFFAVLRVAEETATWRQAVGATILTALAGLTQPYGVLAPGLAAAVAGLRALRLGKRSIASRLAMSTLTAALAVVAGHALWFGLLPHERRPNQWAFVRISSHMIPFYLEAWSYLFLPLLPLALVACRPAVLRASRDDTTTLAAASSAVAFMALCLVYQWPSTRFTAFFWPFLVLALFRTASGRDGVSGALPATFAAYLAATLCLLQLLVLTPAVADAPSLRTMRPDPGRSWLVQFVRSRPVDRMDLADRCGSRSTLCPGAQPLVGSTPYQRRTMAFYEWLVLGRPGS